jgi:hypothetical protein
MRKAATAAGAYGKLTTALKAGGKCQTQAAWTLRKFEKKITMKTTQGKSTELFGGKRHPGFPKGISGNPGGMPKGTAELKELARAHTAQAIETLVQVMTDESQPGPARCLAANSLLDRGYGKPQLHTQTEVTFNSQIDNMGVDELRAYIAAQVQKFGIVIDAEAFEVEDGRRALPSPRRNS